MNRLLRLSIALNLLLLLLVSWMARRSSSVAQPPRVVEAAVSVSSNSVSIAPRFSWSQLEATDYRVYLSNLRKIECPEQTIRDIISADLDSQFALRRKKLRSESTVSKESPKELETKLAALRHEEEDELASLLGDAAPKGSAMASVRPSQRHLRAVMPLVLRTLDSDKLGLDAWQRATVAEVRKQFVEELGAQNPEDPVYEQRWIAAQRNADDRLRGLLGSKVYLQFQLQAANQTPVERESK